MAVRQLTTRETTTLTVWNSKTGTNGPSSPAASWSGSAVATPANSTYLDLGNAAAGVNPFTGTILGFIYYNTDLTDANAATATTAMEDQMYCAARRITLPGVTGNN